MYTAQLSLSQAVMSDQTYHLWTDQQKLSPSRSAPIEITIAAPREDESPGETAATNGTAVELSASSEPLREPKSEESPSPPRVRLSSQSYRDALGGRPYSAEKHRKAPEEQTESEPPKPVGYVKLLRYATAFDWLLMLLGTISAILHGTAFPGAMLVFGDITNAFVNHEASRTLANDNSVSLTLQNSAVVAINFQNLTGGNVDCSVSYTIEGLQLSLGDVLVSIFGNQASCLDDNAFISDINRFIYIFLGIAGGAFFAGWVQVWLFQMAAERQVSKIRLSYYRSILRQDIGWFDVNSSGELSNRLTDDTGKIYAGIGDNTAILIQWVTTFFAAYVVGFIREWRLALVLLGLTPFLAIAAAIFSKVGAIFTAKEQKQYAAAGAVAEEVLTSIRTVVAFGGEQKEAERYDGLLAAAKRFGVKKGVALGVSLALVYFLIFVTYSLSFWFGGYLVSKNTTQAGDVITVFFAILVGAFYLGQAGPNFQNLATAAGAAGAIYDTIDRQPPIDSSSEEGLMPEKFNSTIQFNNVKFSYPTRPDVQVMREVSFEVGVGQQVALVGPSGSGKSTVVQLLQRFYDISKGEILIGGNDIRRLNLKWLRSKIGVVSQEPVLFNTTIGENIRAGKEEATDEEVEQAAKIANINDFITHLPHQYNTEVGEGGTQLSGGQKQRIAIARALVRDPKILLLDEATSALDTESESMVQEALDRAQEGRTTIVIAHRLSTIKNADFIISLENGQVAEIGTHTNLMTNKGLYYDMVTAQSGGTLLTPDFDISGVRLRAQSNRFRSRSGTRKQSRALQRTRTSSAGRDAQLSRHLSVFRTRSDPVGTHTEDEPEEIELSIRSRITPLARKMSRSIHNPLELPQTQPASLEEQEEEESLPDVSLFKILSVNSHQWWLLLLGTLGAMLVGAVFPVFAIVFGEVLRVFALPADQVLGELHPWAGAFLALGVAAALGLLVKNICFGISGENLTSQLRSRSFKAMLRQEISWFDDEKNSSGALTTKLSSSAGQLQGAAGIRLGTLLETLTGLLMSVIIAFVYSWLVTLVILGILPITIVAAAFNTRLITNNAERSQESLQAAQEIAVDSIENIETVVSLGLEDKFYNVYREEVNKSYRTSLLLTVLAGLTYGFSQASLFFSYIITFRFGAYLVTFPDNHVLNVAFEDVYRVFGAIIFGGIAIGAAGSFAPDYAKAKIAARKVFAILDRKPSIDSYAEEGLKPENLNGEIKLKDAIFHYPARPDVQVLRGLNVSVKPGQTLALVGSSGSGKSTVVSLIERFYDPVAGRLTLDGSDFKVLNIHWLRCQIGLVSQEPVLFEATVADNIRYGANFREVSDEEVIAAAKAANIHNFIESLPQGYNTNAGSKGTQLSGGQKQRIAIARALVRDPKILLLDEATSALDTESEKIVQEALDKAREGRTSIVIAHRLSTIYNADCIAVLKGGKVAELGTHSELLAKRGIYHKLNFFQLKRDPGHTPTN